MEPAEIYQGFQFSPCIFGGANYSAPPAEEVGPMEISQSLSLKHLPSYGTAWSRALTAIMTWGLEHHLRVNAACSRKRSSAPSAPWVHPDVGHSLQKNSFVILILKLVYFSSHLFFPWVCVYSCLAWMYIKSSLLQHFNYLCISPYAIHNHTLEMYIQSKGSTPGKSIS